MEIMWETQQATVLKMQLQAGRNKYDLGMRYLEEGDYEQAIVAFTAVIGIDPKQVDAYINLANIYVEQEDYENAVSILQKGLENCDETETLNEKLSEVNQLIAEKESEAAKEKAAGWKMRSCRNWRLRMA